MRYTADDKSDIENCRGRRSAIPKIVYKLCFKWCVRERNRYNRIGN